MCKYIQNGLSYVFTFWIYKVPVVVAFGAASKRKYLSNNCGYFVVFTFRTSLSNRIVFIVLWKPTKKDRCKYNVKLSNSYLKIAFKWFSVWYKFDQKYDDKFYNHHIEDFLFYYIFVPELIFAKIGYKFVSNCHLQQDKINTW